MRCIKGSEVRRRTGGKGRRCIKGSEGMRSIRYDKEDDITRGCVGDDGGRAVVKRGGSSTMASLLPGKNKKKTDGQFFGRSQLKMSTSSLLFLESPSFVETSELMSIRTIYDAYSSAQSLNMFLLRYIKTMNIGGGSNKSPV